MRLAVPFAIVACAAALAVGCGDSGDDAEPGSTATAPGAAQGSAPPGASARHCQGANGTAGSLRATNISCEEARLLVAGWLRQDGCAPADGASRSSCRLEGAYDCLTVATDRGLSVSCARPGHSLAFTVKPQ